MNFDYVIVGGGSAGCVLANRLSASGEHTVCLLEAGSKNNSFLVSIPGAFAAFMFLKKFNWSFNAKPEADITKGKPIFVPRGKGLGGSSSTNAMLYVRGQKEDFDHWESLGNKGWGYKDFLPYFIKSENNERGGNKFHGDNGPLYVSDRPITYPLSRAFVKAGEEAGYKVTDDFNTDDQEGIGYYQCTIKDGKRCGVARGYLKPAMHRPNLTVITKAEVSRVVFEGKTAVGVEYFHKGLLKAVSFNKEVIVSGGAIKSPQILMLSGVGNKEHLNLNGVECIHELNGVGQNLQEHVDSCLLENSKKTDGFTFTIKGLLKMVPEVIKYITNKSGKLSSSITEAGAFLKTEDHLETPDIQLHMVPLMFDDNGRNLKLMAHHGYSCHVCVLRPKSTGSITLKSNDFKQDPHIDYNFFSDPDGEDKKVLVNGFKVARKIFAAPAFDKYRKGEFHPSKEAVTDDEIFEQAKKRLGTVFHPVGTCKMGNDDMAVVDSSLKVHGMKNIRVVDASIMPTLISGNTNAPTIAIAEKASDMILEDA